MFPNPLYPARLPGEIGSCDAKLRKRGNTFSVEFTSFNCEDDDPLIVSFHGGRKSMLRKQIRFTRRVQRNTVKRIRVGGRTMFYGRGDITFYVGWYAQGMSYLVTSKYYGGVTVGQLRQMAASAVPLGASFNGTTSQGKAVNLYFGQDGSGSTGVDFRIPWTASCNREADLASGTSSYGLFPVDATGAFGVGGDRYAYEYEDPDTYDVVRIVPNISGLLTGKTASGTFSANVSEERTCSTGPINWNAVQTAP